MPEIRTGWLGTSGKKLEASDVEVLDMIEMIHWRLLCTRLPDQGMWLLLHESACLARLKGASTLVDIEVPDAGEACEKVKHS